MDITKLSITEIKALAFDELVKLETAQANIKVCSEELKKRNQPEIDEKVEGAVESPAEFLPDQSGGEVVPA